MIDAVIALREQEVRLSGALNDTAASLNECRRQKWNLERKARALGAWLLAEDVFRYEPDACKQLGAQWFDWLASPSSYDSKFLYEWIVWRRDARRQTGSDIA